MASKNNNQAESLEPILQEDPTRTYALFPLKYPEIWSSYKQLVSTFWTSEEVDEKLHSIMVSIHESCVKYGTREDGSVDYVKGANVAGFVKVADAMIDQGLV